MLMRIMVKGFRRRGKGGAGRDQGGRWRSGTACVSIDSVVA